MCPRELAGWLDVTDIPLQLVTLTAKSQRTGANKGWLEAFQNELRWSHFAQFRVISNDTRTATYRAGGNFGSNERRTYVGTSGKVLIMQAPMAHAAT